MHGQNRLIANYLHHQFKERNLHLPCHQACKIDLTLLCARCYIHAHNLQGKINNNNQQNNLNKLGNKCI